MQDSSCAEGVRYSNFYAVDAESTPTRFVVISPLGPNANLWNSYEFDHRPASPRSDWLRGCFVAGGDRIA